MYSISKAYIIIFLAIFPISLLADSIIIEDFNYSEIPTVRPSQSDYKRHLWAQVPFDNAGNLRPGQGSISDADYYPLVTDRKSLEVTIDSTGNMFLQFYPYDDNRFEWNYLREQLVLNGTISQGDWKLDHYNRLEFWIKVAKNQIDIDPKQTNFHFGTYTRSTTHQRKDAESSNGHYYHYYQISPTNNWHKVIVDFHPSHQRGASGSLEHGVKEYPTNEVGYNYFDLMTRFYLDFKLGLSEYPGKHYLDHFRLYREDNLENIEQVYSINAVYVEAENKFIVGWKRDKTENSIGHKIKYSFSDIHQIGWDQAIDIPNNIIFPSGTGGYNGMEFSTTSIDAVATSKIYFAIKPENSNMFRQIELPLRSVPAPPTSLSIN